MTDIAQKIAALSPEKRALLLQKINQQNQKKTNFIKPQSRDSNTFPLSFAQKRLWFLDQLEPGNPFYNIPGAVRLQGNLNIKALEQSLNEIIKRHEILRTTFTTVDGHPVQIISPSLQLTIPVVDLSQSTFPEQEAQKLISQEALSAFDLESGQLLRVRLLQISQREYVFLFTLHHIIADGWSMGLLVEELATLYPAFCTREQLPYLPKLPIQYADFAVWQQERLQGEVLEKQLNYWKKQLNNISLLSLPTDKPRPNIPSFKGASYDFVLSYELTEKLRSLSRGQGVTLFMTLLAAFKVLLYRYTGQDDICIGSPIANRNREEIEKLIGFFVNTLVLRSDLSGHPTFTELLSRVKDVTLGAYAHQDLPFEKLVEELQPERHLNYNPLFQVAFQLQNTPTQTLELPELTLNNFDNDAHQTAKFDLDLCLSENDTGLVGSFEYSSELFESATIARMVAHFHNLLSAIVDNPQATISELSLLTLEEKNQFLFDWNNTQIDWEKDVCIHQLIELQAQKTPDSVAVVFGEEKLTYQELNQKSNQLAFYLQSLGVKPDTLVGICVERSLEMVVGLLGILKAGGAYVPLDPAYPQERLSLMLEDAQVKFLLTQNKLLNHISHHHCQIICIDTDWKKINNSIPNSQPQNLNSSHLAYVIYTSGSTGKPKGVQINHASVVNFLQSMRHQPGLTEADILLAVTSISFDIAALEIYLPLICGARLVVVSREVAMDGEKLSQNIAASGATVMQATPATWRMLLTSGWVGSKQLKILCGGEALSYDLAENLLAKSAELWNLYGPTETTIWSTVYQVDPNKLSKSLIPIGRPIANTQIYILDQQLQPVPIGVPGELYIGGAGLSRGYLNRPELTTEKFISSTFNQKLYKTGDLARYLPDGNIEYLERIDNQVKLRGFRIELGEIETTLRQHYTVQEAVVIAREDVPGNQQLVAYIVPKLSVDVSELIVKLRQYLQSKLPQFMIPSAYMLLDKLPLTPNGKVDRKSLPNPDTSQLKRENEYAKPRNTIEENLVRIWSQILNVEKVGIYDNFFNLGGHSLLATQVMSRIRDEFNVTIPLRCLFESPTIAGLGEVIDRKSAPILVEYPPIQVVSRDEELLLSFAQQRLWFLSQLIPNSPLYNLSAPVRLTGLLNIPALEKSFNAVVQRHETLRTSFVAVEGKPIQFITPNLTLELPIIDLENLAPTEQANRVEEIATSEKLQPFDLNQAPLLRVTLLKLSATEYVLLLTMHHIISDAWSMGVLVQEMATLYEAFCASESNPLPPLSIQYADFAMWQRKWLQGEVLEAQLAYWKQQLLGGNLPTLKLPIQREQSAIPSYKGATYNFELSEDLSQQIIELSRQENVTLFMTLLAGLQTLLYRYTNLYDIVVGTDIANRTQTNTELLIGFFINLLVLRTDMRGNPSFRELLQRVREVTLQAYAHQDLPFEKLVEELRSERNLQQTPLFQVLFVLQNTPTTEIELADLKLHPLEIEDGQSKFDLALFAVETEHKISFGWKYKTDLFAETDIARLSNHFQTLLTSIVAAPDTKINSLDMLTPEEKQKQITDKTKRQSANLQKFKKVKPKAVSFAESQLVKTDYLQPGETLPLVCQPNTSDLDFIDWAKNNQQFIDSNLFKHGAILFRGFNANSVADFETFAQAVCPELFGEYGDLPREGLGGKVYGSTPYPADKAILFHNESSHMHRWPMKIWFYCVQPAQERGETPIVDCRKVYQLLNPEIRERFAEKGLMYVRNYTDGLDVSWQNFFHTTDKAAVEKFCKQNAIEWEWKADGGLKTKEIRQAIAQHPKTGESVFFNQIQLHHIAYLDSSVRESLLSLFGEENLPRNVYYGDATPIEQSVIDEVTSVYEQAEIAFPWQKGDILMLDNMLTAHARNPYVGKRKIVVAMGEIVNSK
ncbi:non-ribosomal peptide synthetase [Anabaena sp. CA = ATCC 33047]|uniref:non-ribosomal peptide synthetase n=1 Tax=Anabaena sp. (strain CA / ATCC 33047) TaxID=52271 RepID=UPI00082BC80E|nr:non-ribosomal peptide synthetase [Anabaena sp. CA = ATCC 33047]